MGQALLDRGLGPGRPLMILAENGIDHAAMMLGAMHVGVPVVPVSTAYARLSQDFGKLRYIFDLVEPGLIYVDEADRYAKALETIGATRLEIVASKGTLPGCRLTPVSALTEVRPTPAVGRAFGQVGPDTVAKILFTSGSTGQPKGVINTQRMMCANQESAAAAWTFLTDHPPVIVDWLPWNHTFGGNHNFNMMLRNGGTLYIDEGKPVPALIGRTVANLREVSPTVYFNVPRGYAALLDHLEADEALRGKFFARLDLLFYAAAALPQSLWDRLEKLGTRGARPQGAVHLLLGAHGDGAGRDDGALRDRASRQHRRAGTGHGGEARARRRQARDPRQGAQRHARLFQGAGPDRQGLRRGGLAQDRRRGAACRSRQSGGRPAVRRPHGRELQAVVRHLGQRRHAAAGRDRRRRAGDRGCRRHRARPRRHRAADLPEPRRAQEPVPAALRPMPGSIS